MKEAMILVFHLLTTIAKLLGPGGSKAVIAENLLLKHQLLVHRRSRKRSPNLLVHDRALLGFWTLFLIPRRMARAAIIIKPSTLLRFHAALKRRKYRLLYSAKKRGKPGSTGVSWLTFIGHTKDSLWSIDLFRCESILLKSHWVLVVMDQFTRRIIGFGVHAGDVDGPALCRMFNDAISKQGLPRHISSDNDPLFLYHRWQANLRILDIDEIKTVPHVPISHPFVERLIGSVRRELLDNIFFWTSTDLNGKLRDYQNYFNRHRGHSSLDGGTPEEIRGGSIADLGTYHWQSHCRGLFELPIAA